MEFILSILYLYVVIYTIYFFILSIRNLNDRPFYIEKKYSKYDGGKYSKASKYAKSAKLSAEKADGKKDK